LLVSGPSLWYDSLEAWQRYLDNLCRLNVSGETAMCIRLAVRRSPQTVAPIRTVDSWLALKFSMGSITGSLIMQVRSTVRAIAMSNWHCPKPICDETYRQLSAVVFKVSSDELSTEAPVIPKLVLWTTVCISWQLRGQKIFQQHVTAGLLCFPFSWYRAGLSLIGN
jgi:hypothetical protein